MSLSAARHRESPSTERTMRFVVVLATGLLLQACTESIVQDGHPLASIIVAKDAPVELVRAATELQAYVLKTSGASLPIRNESNHDKERVEIRLAVSPIPVDPAGDRTREIVHSDGYVIKSRGRTITILGGSPRGTLYGVYDFVERVLGVRWFMPTPMGEDIQTMKTIPVPDLEVVKNPAFPFVSGFTWAGSPGVEDWELRMRVRVGKQVSFGHNWYNIYPFTKENFAKNPEMFAMVDGKRGNSTQLCTSNPEVIRVTVEAARRAFNADPEAPLFSISPNDGRGWCECDRCKHIDALYGVTDGTVADRFVHYANAVMTELQKTNPGKQVGIYAYAEHTAPPKAAKPFANYAMALARMPWEFCNVHAIEDASCEPNRRFLSYLKGWQALTKHTGIYEYYGHFFAFTPWPIVHSMRRDIPLFKAFGIERFISETQQNWANQGINFYVAAKLIEDPSRDVDALLDEYFSRFYGKAKVPMRQYFDAWETAMQNTGAAGDGGYAWLSMFTPELVGRAGAFLEQAEQAAAKDEEKFRARIAFARLGFRYTEAFTKMIDAGLKKDVRGVLEWSEETQKRIRITEGSAPQAFFVSIAIDQTRYMARLLTTGVPPWISLQPSTFRAPLPTTP